MNILHKSNESAESQVYNERVLVLEDEISHQVRMETALAEIAKEMGITIKS